MHCPTPTLKVEVHQKLEGKPEGQLEGNLERKSEGKPEGDLEGNHERNLEGRLEGPQSWPGWLERWERLGRPRPIGEATWDDAWGVPRGKRVA